MLTENEKIEALVGLGIKLNQLQDLDILMEHILAEARNFVNADAGSIYIRDVDRLIFSYTQNETLQKRMPPGGKLVYSTFSIPVDETSIAGFSAATGKTLNISDVWAIGNSRPYRFNKDFDEKTGYRTRSVLTIPLKTLQGNVIGILQIINAQDGNKKVSLSPRKTKG